MARLLNDSEDDLPDLDVVLRHHQTSAPEGQDEPISKSREVRIDRTVLSKPESLGEKKSIIAETPKLKARKRVLLTRRDDNPLLRPIARAGKTTTTSSLLRSPELQPTSALKKLPKESEVSIEMQRKPSSTVVATRIAIPPSRVRATKRAPRDDHSASENESDGLSDFIANDSSFVEEVEEDDGDSFVERTPPPPRSTRKLVRGRRPRRTVESEDDMDFVSQPSKVSVEPEQISRKDGEDQSDLEEPVAILSFSPSENKQRKVSKTTRFTTPPPSPSKRQNGLVSPSKKLNRIPLTPHRPSMEAFWSQDVINEWNDEFSPKKDLLKSLSKLKLDSNSDDSDHVPASPTKSPMKKDKAATQVKKAFAAKKHELASSFLLELDQKITSGQVSRLTESTGGIAVIWSKTLQTTAGRANWRREGIRSRPLDNGPPPKPTYRHFASIELAEKVIDDEDRLLNVIAHEFCHLANFMISNIKNNPHGKEFQAWGAKVSKAFGDRGVEVTTKHSYAIDYKYIWTCTSCSRDFKRQSKSIDPARHSCGVCKSKLVQTKPVPRTGNVAVGPNEYQLFVKEHMKTIRQQNPGSPQKEIMGLVGKKYREYKALKGGEVKNLESVSVRELERSREGSVDEVEDAVDAVARKLNFIDLTGS